MYKSYSSDKAVTQDSKVTIKEFTPASVKLDVQLSGFLTSYSYYVANEEGSSVKTKDVAKANATANDYIGDGTATYTITREGIPSTLLKFESFKLTVDGKEFTGNEADKTITYGSDDCYGHTTWGKKDIVATVTYTNLATGAPETESKTLTRHITGLPYSSSNIDLSGTKESETISFKVASNTSIELKLIDVTASSLSRWQKGHLYVKIGNTDFGKQIEAGNTKFDNVHSDEIKLQGELLNSNGDLFLTRNTNLPGPYVKISNVSVKYN